MRFLTSPLGRWVPLLIGLCLAFAAYHYSLPVSGPVPSPLGVVEAKDPKPVPALSFTDKDGKALSLADFHGKLVVLDVWATWCAPCRKEFPRLDKLQAAFGDRDLAVVAVSVDLGGKAQVEKFYQEIKVSHLAEYLDPSGESTKTLGLRGLPTTLILDRDGREVARVEGEAAWDGPEVKALLQRLMVQS